VSGKYKFMGPIMFIGSVCMLLEEFIFVRTLHMFMERMCVVMGDVSLWDYLCLCEECVCSWQKS
jgi:hypothetical protein